MEYIMRTSRLGLRRWKESDLEPFAEMNMNPEVMKYFPSTLTVEESNSLVERINEHFDKHGFGLWAVELLESKEFIGFIGLKIPGFEAEFTPCVEIGWRLSNEFWGNGYATEGAKACLDYAFTDLGISEIVSFTAVLNKPSMRVMEKLGMNYEGEFLHPKLDENHPLCKHVLYKIIKK
ncbi:GNAT family N-acetyltransferase [Wukongibacter baidiensis]|uniref:GNAT family N-acetyltransferase n=1 Tax=Wukongibacter baidiensis TaxID=1723361 RepID=UPI003D7FC487